MSIILPQKTAIVFESELNKHRDVTLIDNAIEEARWIPSEICVVGGGFHADQCIRYAKQKKIPSRIFARGAMMDEVRRNAMQLANIVEGMIFIAIKRAVIIDGKEKVMPPPNWMNAFRDAMRSKQAGKDSHGKELSGGDIFVVYVDQK